jgi:hypothetical protein
VHLQHSSSTRQVYGSGFKVRVRVRVRGRVRGRDRDRDRDRVGVRGRGRVWVRGRVRGRVWVSGNSMKSMGRLWPLDRHVIGSHWGGASALQSKTESNDFYWNRCDSNTRVPHPDGSF